MVPISALLLPILLAAVLVFLVSSLFHMVLPWHRKDFGGLPAEDDIQGAMRKAGVAPGDYVLPYAATSAEMNEPDFKAKMEKGPVAFITVVSDFGMGKSLLVWFIYCGVVGVFVAYGAGRSLGPGTEYLTVFRLSGTLAFLGYALALWQNSIWYKRPWSTTLKLTIDGMVYSLVTAGAFGWLWPAT